MTSKKTLFIGSVIALAIFILAVGTIIHLAILAFGIYLENENGSRAQILRLDYWNAVFGAAVIFIPARLAAAFNKKMKSLEAQKFLKDGGFFDMDDQDDAMFWQGLEKSFDDTRYQQDGTPWDPPKRPDDNSW